MHKKLLEQASPEQIKEFAVDAMSMLKETNPETYATLEMHLYKELYGCHFNDWLLEKATSTMDNEDGSVGKHWSLNDTNQVARQYNISFDTFNEYDWNYTINMIYSDYYGAVPNELGTYVKIAHKFLKDKDAEPGKALKYYLTFKD